ncbi:hypothetical protein BT93_F1684 [Corymbia citriodora subsp. variegata]|nr:hypothetical protein BT93_F1684 [Corymbia citriodora subsp. variegata]
MIVEVVGQSTARYYYLISRSITNITKNLYRRSVLPVSLCLLCKSTLETPEHIFLLCPWTNEIWASSTLQIPISSHGLSSIDKWLLNFIKSERDSPSLELVTKTLWYIWKVRNNAIFRAQKLDPQGIVTAALASHTKTKKVAINRSNALLNWVPPACGSLKPDVDSSFLRESNSGSVASLCQDSTGKMTGGFARVVKTRSVFQAETLGLLQGLGCALSRSDQKSEVESNNLSGVQQVNGDKQPTWEERELVQASSTSLTFCPTLAWLIALELIIMLGSNPRGRKENWSKPAVIH